jgi:hypothetical protein
MTNVSDTQIRNPWGLAAIGAGFAAVGCIIGLAVAGASAPDEVKLSSEASSRAYSEVISNGQAAVVSEQKAASVAAFRARRSDIPTITDTETTTTTEYQLP